MANKNINDELENVIGGNIEGNLWYARYLNLDTNEYSSWYGGYSTKEDAQRAIENLCASKPGRYKIEYKGGPNGFVPEYEEVES